MFVVITTHTDRHLDACLRGVLGQSSPPRAVVVGSDRDDPAVLEAVRGAMSGAPIETHFVVRPHQGKARPAQVRNNACRVVRDLFDPAPDDPVLFLDGDIVLEPDAIAKHRQTLGRGHDGVIGFRAELDEPETGALLNELGDRPINDALFRAHFPERSDAILARRAKRYRKAALLAKLGGRKLGIVKAHKPKFISCHMTLTWAVLERLNGFDDLYDGHGFEDDDISKRFYALRPVARAAIEVESTRALHLWHPTRQIPDRLQSPEGQRFSRIDLPARAEHGIANPTPQDEPSVTRVD